VPRRSKHPLLTGHTRRAPLVEIKYEITCCQSQYGNDSLTLYGTSPSAYVPVIFCNRKQGHYNNRRLCKMMTLNEIHYNPATSIFLYVVCLVLKSPHTQNMLLRNESTGRCTHHKQVKVVCYYIEKES
jgi:hypothetical protein